ncbi:MAG: hypothetical protein KDB23_13985, partial [Planctomycetales bacterium]|nr:hypothetical protein [Planctomycetales bacterium]
DKGSISLAGAMGPGGDAVDWYMFEVRFASTQQPGGNTAEITIDLDYADGLARSDLGFAVYEANFVTTTNMAGGEITAGQLIYHSLDGGGPDDHPAPLQGSDLDDLSRGSVGLGDPFLGPISLREGFYLLQITNPTLTPIERLQYTQALPPNPYARFEPIDAIARIAEDRIGEPITEDGQGTAFAAPQVPLLLDPAGAATPFTLADVTLFVSNANTVSTVDPFSGGAEIALGAFAGVGATDGLLPTIGDFALRDNPLFDPTSADPEAARGQRLMAFANGIGDGNPPSDANTGGYIFIDITEKTTAESATGLAAPGTIAIKGVGQNGALTDDTIQSWMLDPNNPDPANPSAVEADTGMLYDAIVFNPTSPDINEGYAIGRRGDNLVTNILVRFNAITGQVLSATGDVQPDTERFPVPNPVTNPGAPLPTRKPNAGFDIVENGVLDTTAGGGPGGNITGIALMNGTMYAVTNTGGLFQVQGYAGQGARVRYLTTINQHNDDPEATPVPINFQGLTVGPKTVEKGAYSNMLFAVDNRGNLYAFTTDGELQPIFADGAYSVRSGVSGATGLSFGTQDANLWHVTQQRAGDVGHGRLFPSPSGGGASFYFGEEQNPGGGAARLYDHLGGTHGSMVTEPFSLAGYDDSHDPYFYFTYYMVTEEASKDPLNGTARDSFRVFVADDSAEDNRGQWHLVASNQPGETGAGAFDVNPDDTINIDVQQLWDNSWQDVPFVQSDPTGPNGTRDPFPYTDDDRPFDPLTHDWAEFGPVLNETLGVWRQARISLRDFAGADSLRIRFDFSTAGSMAVGTKGGVELRAVAGSEIEDGATFVIDDVTFEFDSGYSLVTRGGRALTDGETFTIEGADGSQVTYEMDSDGTTQPNNIAIAYTLDDNSTTIADAIATAITAGGPAGVIPHLLSNRVNLEGAALVQLGPAGGLELTGSVGVADGNVPVIYHTEMTANDVAEAMVQPLADSFANGLTNIIKLNDNTVTLFGHRVRNQGPLGLTATLPADVDANGNTNFTNPLAVKNTPVNNGRNDERLYAFDEEDFNFTVPFEGVYVDDLVIGFTAFGERGADLRPDYPYEPTPNYDGIPNVFEDQAGALAGAQTPPGSILTGEYQVEIRRAADFAAGLTPTRSFDPRDRLSQNVSLNVSAGADLYDGQTFTVSDGIRAFVFEFDDVDVGNGVAAGNVAVPFTAADLPWTVVESIRDSINGLFLQNRLQVTAAGSNGAEVGSVGNSTRLDLFGTIVIVKGDIEILASDEKGATNTKRDQGQLIISGNSITHSAMFGVVVEDAYRDMPCNPGMPGDTMVGSCSTTFFDVGNTLQHTQGTASDYGPSLGSVRNLREINQDSLAPGVVIENNVVAFSGQGGIHFSGDAAGKIIIAPIGGPRNAAEVWDDGDVHFLLRLIDNNGYAEVFEFRAGGQAPLGLTDQVIAWDNTDDCPDIHPLGSCGPRYSPQNPDMAEAILTAIARSNLDVRPYRSRPDELYIDGLAEIQSVIVEGDATSVTFFADLWFYPFNIDPPQSVIPYGRIVNNTLVGLGGSLPGNNLYNEADFSDTGILVEDNADPTLLNNVVVNYETGIHTDLTSSAIVVGGTLYQGNIDNAKNISVGDFAIELNDAAPLFVDRDGGNFYPADLSRIIDSSVDSLEDRSEVVTVKDPIGLSRSPILAPNFDVLGQLRIDDPRVEPPEGFGENVFKDRGAIDRVDFLGPIAQFQIPLDNDVSGVDKNPADDQVRVENATLSRFVVQLVDLGEASAPTGTGIDDTVIASESVILRRDGVVLQEGVDYRFDYQATTNQILLTPQAGVWLSGYTYEIELINQDRFVVTTGDLLPDGSVLTVRDKNGISRNFEIETGYSLQVPETLTILVPAGTSGLSAVADKEIFTISNGVRLVTFEFDSNNSITPGRIRVPFQPSSTPDQVAAAIVTAIETANLGLAPVNLGDGLVHVGGSVTTLLDTAVTALQQFGQPGVFVDGQTISIQDAGGSVRFEFDSNGAVSGTNVAIPFDPNSTRRELALSLIEAINNNATLNVTAQLGTSGMVNLGAGGGLSISTETSNLALLGQPGTSGGNTIPVSFRLTEDLDQRGLSTLLKNAIDASVLSDLFTLIDEAGRLVIINAEDVQGISTQFIPAVRDIAGNLLRTNQELAPFGTSLLIDLPAPLDFGDAPDPTYATLLGSNGA